MTAGRRIVRYAFRERLLHALTALSYVYLLLTGLAFWTPALYWIAAVLGGGYLSRVLHPWVGLIFSGALLWMFVTWRTDMRVKPEDRAWRSAMSPRKNGAPESPARRSATRRNSRSASSNIAAL